MGSIHIVIHNVTGSLHPDCIFTVGNTGDGVVALGISVGVLAVTLGMLACAIVLFKGKNRFFGTLALIAATITIVSMLGLAPLPS